MIFTGFTFLVAAAFSASRIGTIMAFPGESKGGHGEDVDYHAHPLYEFDYKVHDPHTGDAKAQWEHRDGDALKGFYTLKEADGSLREVHYTSNHKDGFNAIVKKVGHGYHPPIYGSQEGKNEKH